LSITTSKDFELFPNPAREMVKVSLLGYEGSDIEIQLIDQLGKRLKVVPINNVSDTIYEIDLNNVQSGIYSLWIFSEGIKPLGKKMIVSN